MNAIINAFNADVLTLADNRKLPDNLKEIIKTTARAENVDWPNVLDGLIDISVYAYGALYKIGLAAKDYETFFQRVSAWNKTRGLNTFNWKKEFTFFVEEFYEINAENHADSRDYALKQMADVEGEFDVNWLGFYRDLIALCEKYGQIIITEKRDVFTQDWNHYFELVLAANDLKGKKTDKFGKIVKDKATFQEPEHKFK